MTLSPELALWLNTQGFSADDLNAAIHNRTTPLMLAARIGDYALVAELIRHGVELNATNHDGNNALWLACFNGDPQLIALLIASGITLNNQNDNGASCLMYAASAGKTEVVAQLLKAGADTRLTSLDDFTALDVAGNLECLTMLRRA
ncbi:MAG: ankyrin repeat domain-containing protein [Burkholderiales bacterium]